MAPIFQIDNSILIFIYQIWVDNSKAKTTFLHPFPVKTIQASSRITEKNKFSELPNGSQTHDLPEY